MNMTVNIFLDDNRDPTYIKSRLGDLYPKNWVVCRDYFEFVKAINKFPNIGLVSFDHDLQCFEGDKEWTGLDACTYLINRCIEKEIKFPNWYVHTNNSWGRKNIINDILNYLKHFEDKKYNWIYYNSGIINGTILP
jgi:hypothetical protein